MTWITDTDGKPVVAEADGEMEQVDLTPAERDTILAALRCWQSHGSRVSDYHELLGIATDGGQHPKLSAEEIDALCERINT